MLKFGSKHDSNIVYKCTVRLLEDTEILECEYKPHHKGKYLLEYVCKQLNLIEQDYLGLRYVDNQDQRHWLDLGKSICKQVKDLDPVLFSFRVKFYPPDPFRLKEEITRYQIFLQLKRDLLHGRLYCGTNEASTLAALILQGELGDYDPEIHVGNYISDMKLLLKQTEAIEEKAMEIHQKQLKSHSQSQVEHTFLKIACQLDTYGVDPHPVKGLLQDHKGSQLYLGINYSGILTFQGSRKTHHFRWPDIQKINYEGKMFIIHLNYNDKKHTVGFKCPSGQACRHVWRCAIEQMLFFTNSLRRIARHDDTEFSHQSILNVMEKFVKTVNKMDETILVPCRLMDQKVGDEQDPACQNPKTKSSHSVHQLLSSTDLFEIYSMLNNVKDGLLWGGQPQETAKAITTTPVTSITPVTKGHNRRPSSVSVTSTNSSISTLSDTDSESGSNEMDSGIDDAAQEEGKVDRLAQDFRRHLHGLTSSLRQMTEAAQYLTWRYQYDIGGPV